MISKRLAILICILGFAFSVSAQQPSSPTPVSQDPQAVSLATQALTALTGATQVSDITLTGTATQTIGPDIESGNVTLKAFGTADSRLDLNFTNGYRSEIRNQANGVPQGFWIGLDGTVNTMASQNTMTDAVWFFPVLSGVLAQLSNANLAVAYIGPDTKNGVAVQHIQFMSLFGGTTSNANNLLSTLTTMDFYLDATTSLPVAICFNTHPINDATTNIPVEIDFSNYQAVSGVQVPFHIQKYLNGTLLLDIAIQSAVLNSGLTDSAFSAN